VTNGHIEPENGDPSALGAFGSTEIDVFEITASASGNLTMTLTFDALGGAVDMDLVPWDAVPNADPNFTDVLSFDGASTADPETATIAVTAGQKIFISVNTYGPLPPTDGAYTLITTLQ
jgi:hypothetical protein